MKKICSLTVLKYAGLGLTVAGTIINFVVGSKENEKVLEKLVDKRLGK